MADVPSMRAGLLLIAAVATAGPALVNGWIRNRASLELTTFTNAPDPALVPFPTAADICRSSEVVRRPHWCGAPEWNPDAWPAVIARERVARNVDAEGQRADALALHLSSGSPLATVKAADEINAGFSFGGAHVLPDGTASLAGFGSGFGFIVVTGEDGCFDIAVRARNSQPPPIRLELIVPPNHWPLEFELGNDAWTERHVFARLRRGRHAARVRFMNDLFDPARQIDRNGVVDRVTVTAAAGEACAGA